MLTPEDRYQNPCINTDIPRNARKIGIGIYSVSAAQPCLSQTEKNPTARAAPLYQYTRTFGRKKAPTRGIRSVSAVI